MQIRELIDSLTRYEIQAHWMSGTCAVQSKSGEWCKFEEIKERLIQLEKVRNNNLLAAEDRRQILLETQEQTINNINQLIQNR